MQMVTPVVGGVRRLTWLLLGMLLTLAFWGARTIRTAPVQPAYIHTQLSRRLPEVVPPTGILAEVFEDTRPATLRIEARVDTTFIGGPLGVGSGFFISEDGLLVTAYHVVDTTGGLRDRFGDDLSFTAVAPDETEYELELVGFDAYLDLAVMQAAVPGPVDYLPLASVVPEVGSSVVAIGNSRDSFLEARVGDVTQIGVESPRASFAENTIQLTAPLAPGDSGGPVINEAGEVVGVVSYIAFNGGQEDIPEFLRGYIGAEPAFSSYAAPVLAEAEEVTALIAGSRRDVPVIGFSWPNINYDPARIGEQLGPGVNYPNLGRRPGVVIGDVRPGGPADLAGLQSLQSEGNNIRSADIITAVDGEQVEGFYELLELLYLKGVGETVTVTVQRGGETFRVRLELGAKREVFN